jgi:pectinesterase
MKKLLFIGCFLVTFISIFAAEKYDFIVAQDGSGNFTSVQAAIDACKAFPDNPIVVFVKNGTYKEKVKVSACNNLLTIKGESVEKTIITYDDFFDKINRGRNSTFYTYTFMVEANDFRLENITIENSSGPVGQAVALHVEGDRCILKNCRILGNQDTLYTAGETSRQYFVDCYIEGTTDFIFGAATVFFERCTLHSKTDSYLTAASTTKGKEFGYVFYNCKLTASDNITKAYLGRPWRDYANVVFIHSEMGAHISPVGWTNWANTQRDKTAYFAEFENSGFGANIDNRVIWSKILTTKEASKYTAEYVLRGNDNWNPKKQ